MLRLPAARLTALRFLHLAIPLRFIDEGLSNPVTPSPGEWRRQDLPRSWGSLHNPSAHVQATPVGPTLLAITKCRRGPRSAHDEGSQPLYLLSGLSSMALEHAVYASPGLLPHHSARLASRCWLDSPARASHPKGFQRKVSKHILTFLTPFPSFGDNWNLPPFVARALSK